MYLLLEGKFQNLGIRQRGCLNIWYPKYWYYKYFPPFKLQQMSGPSLIFAQSISYWLYIPFHLIVVALRHHFSRKSPIPARAPILWALPHRTTHLAVRTTNGLHVEQGCPAVRDHPGPYQEICGALINPIFRQVKTTM